MRKAPACTVLELAHAMRQRYSSLGSEHPINVVGIRPDEKIHEILVNEYEMRRAAESSDYFCIHPEYRPTNAKVDRILGDEYTSANTTQITDAAAIGALLDQMGQVEYFI